MVSSQNLPTRYLVSAPGKVILFGEHAVVYGTSAIAGSVNLRTYLLIEKREDGMLEAYVPDIGLDQPVKWNTELFPYSKVEDDKKEEFNEELAESLKSLAEIESDKPATVRQQQSVACLALLYLFTLLSSRFPETKRGLTIRVRSALPVGAGLGSSASYSVCLTTGLLLNFEYISLTPDSRGAELIKKYSFLAEKIIHGNPSGIDNAVATFGGAVLYKKGSMESLKGYHENIAELPFRPFRFLLTNTKVARDTKTQVANVRIKFDKYPEIIKPILDAIQNISDHFKTVLINEDNNITQDTILEDLIDLNHHFINSLGVGHPALDKVREITAQFELHSKLTGAGGGGCALTFIRDGIPDVTIETVKKSLSLQGFECFETLVGGHGAGALVINDTITAQEFMEGGLEWYGGMDSWHYFV
ncbi:3686_t:CDS:10 [Paraglomus occultum]|uniref:Mevalonate kinase n=1 Tax=Paraglomus occultum TaxID=144539 RepID=A0A9N9AZX8_9GLOM|nr:3686_t:CDS:10 [Paraglomus occultum]